MESGTTLDNEARWIEERLVTSTKRIQTPPSLDHSLDTLGDCLEMRRDSVGREKVSSSIAPAYLSKELSVVLLAGKCLITGSLGEKVGQIMGRGRDLCSLKEFACGLFEKSSDCCASSFPDLTSRLSREQRFQTFVPATSVSNKIGYLCLVRKSKLTNF